MTDSELTKEPPRRKASAVDCRRAEASAAVRSCIGQSDKYLIAVGVMIGVRRCTAFEI